MFHYFYLSLQILHPKHIKNIASLVNLNLLSIILKSYNLIMNNFKERINTNSSNTVEKSTIKKVQIFVQKFKKGLNK